MNYFKILPLLILFVSASAFGVLHKYYISVTQLEYVEEKKSIQIVSRIFIDDFENVLRERYDEGITLDAKKNYRLNDMYIEKYLSDKLQIKINNEQTDLVFIGKEIDIDIIKCYLEIENVESIDSLEVSNKVLFDVFSGQQNMIKLNIYSERKSFILTSQNEKAVLNFN
ncbi:DUF6702 family protein [Hyunsoonleella rubra]|uniref:DUF6702 family protein n=1 Tax=Hyunsoonleella rubra TaxID=1737062 RepID=A0ABW5T837_9FLAO